jgi:hypothetical protein
MLPRPTILIESDNFAGFHAVIIAEVPPDDAVLHVTDSYLSPEDALEVARRWIDDNNRALSTTKALASSYGSPHCGDSVLHVMFHQRRRTVQPHSFGRMMGVGSLPRRTN